MDNNQFEVDGIPNTVLLEMLTIACIRRGVNLSFLEDEDVRKLIEHLLHLSPTTDYLYNSVAFPKEEELLKEVRIPLKFELTRGYYEQNIDIFLQLRQHIDPSKLTLLLDGTKKPMGCKKMVALLVSAVAQTTGKLHKILFSLNSSAEACDSVSLADWVRSELHSHGLDPSGIQRLVADNANDMIALAGELGATHIGCSSHLLDLVLDESWDKMDASWVPKMASTIAAAKDSYSVAKSLEEVQSGSYALKLVDWSPTRWQGKYIATERFHKVASIAGAREKLVCEVTDDEMVAIATLLPLLKHMATLTALLSGETIPGIDTSSMPPVHYGAHLHPILWHTLSFLICCANLDWNTIPTDDQRRSIWKFCITCVDGMFFRFLKNPSNETIAGYALAKGSVLDYDIKHLENDIQCLLKNDLRGCPSHTAQVSLLLFSPERIDTLFRIADGKWEDSSPFNDQTRIAHIKFQVKRLFQAYDDLCSPTRQMEVLTECSTRIPFGHTSHSQTPGAVDMNGFQRISESLLNPSTLTKYRHSATRTSSALESQFTSFKQMSLPSNTNSSLAWACSDAANKLPLLRNLIMDIHSIPLGNAPAEQVFSVLKYHVDAWNSRLNELDLETRIVLAYNLREMSQAERARIFGWSPYWHLFQRHENLVQQLEEFNTIPIGASHRRNTTPATTAAAIKRRTQSSPMLTSRIELTSQSTPPSQKQLKRAKLSKKNVIQPVVIDVEFGDTSSAPTVSTQPTHAATSSGPSTSRLGFHQSLVDVHDQNKGNPTKMRENSKRSIRDYLREKNLSGPLIELFDKVKEEVVPKLLMSLARSVKEEVPYADLVLLLAVEFNHASTASGTSSAISDKYHTVLSSSNTMDLEHTIEADEFEYPGLLSALRDSFESFQANNRFFEEEMESLWKIVKRLGLQLQNVPAEGDCLYECLQLAWSTGNTRSRSHLSHADIRTRLSNYMGRQKKSWFPYLEAKETKKAFVDSQSKPHTYGDKNVVKAAAEEFCWEIHVYSKHGDEPEKFVPNGNEKPSKQVVLFLVASRHYMYASPVDST